MLRGRRREQVLDERDVSAEDLRQVRVGLGEFDEKLGELDPSQSLSAVLPRDAEASETGERERLHLSPGESPLAFPLQHPTGDAGEERSDGADRVCVRHQVYSEIGCSSPLSTQAPTSSFL